MTESRKRAVLGSESLDFGSISAGEIAELSFAADTHHGSARAGDAVALGPPANFAPGFVATGYVNASDEVVVRMHNTTAGALDPSAGGVEEVQDLVHDHTSGTFTISFNGEAESAVLQWDDDGTGISAYLEQFTIGAIAVTVTIVENGNGDWTITYNTPVLDVPEIVVEDDSLAGGTTIDLTETVKGVSAEDALWSFALVI